MPCAEQHVQAVPGCRERSLACSNWVHVRSDKGRERRVVDGDAGRKAERVVGAALSKPDALNASSTAELQSRARRFADFGSEPCINSTAQEENQKKKCPKNLEFLGAICESKLQLWSGFFFFFSSFSTKTLPAAALNAEKELLMLGPRHFTATTLCTAF